LKNIALDATYSLGANLTGVGVYSREILHGLAGSHPEERFFWHYRPHRWWRAGAEARPRNASRHLLLDWPAPAGDLFHGLNQRLPSARARQTVCTFHDLFVMTGDYSTPEFRERFTKQARHAAERSDRIVCVSQFTANQVRDLLRVEPARLRVIHHGVRFCPGQSQTAAVKSPVVLFVGAIQRRKNVARLIQAFGRAAPSGPWKLLLIGSEGYGAAEALQALEDSPARQRIERRGYVSDSELGALYQSAAIFAFPSLDEGFGMPVLEAMAHALPVVAASSSALPEVCGDAAILVDPLETDAMAGQLRRLMEDNSLRNELGRKAQLRATQFSWSEAVAKTWKVYEELL